MQRLKIIYDNVSDFSNIIEAQVYSEDCLYLDLYVPESVLHNATAKVPVLFWIHGGAFMVGGSILTQGEVLF